MIFKMLPPRELAKCRLICHQWNHEILEVKMLMRKIWSNITAERCIQEARNGNIEFFLALMEFATDPNPSDEDGWTPLHRAAGNGYLEVCRLIMNLCKVKNPVNEFDVTPLHSAAFHGHLEVSRLILDKCEDKNPANLSGVTPLHCAADQGHLEVCRLILDRCEDKRVRGRGMENLTLSHWAAMKGHLKVCRCEFKAKNSLDTYITTCSSPICLPASKI